MARLGVIFGDQLDRNHAVLTALDSEQDQILMGELAAETDYVWHHVKKVALIFSAMRHFASELSDSGWDVHYRKFDADSSCRTFTDLVGQHCRQASIDEIVVSWPGEWRVLEQIRKWESELDVPVTVLPDQRFICPLEDFHEWADGRKQLRMEFFYRQMRHRTGLLMDDDKPSGGKWNFDQSNRRAWRGDPEAVAPMSFTPDPTTTDVLERVREAIDGFGELENFDFPVTRTQAKRALTHFIQRALPNFGDYQDAMDDDEDYLFHSRLSVCLNLGLLDPLEVCRAAETEWREGRAPLNAVEGFIRQIIGWREFIRGIYWMEMPDYAERNGLDNRQSLPDWYWTGKTDMRCLAKTIDATRRNAYAHHIQRLMVTGNFALILGIVPREICEWYLAVYADAYDWVELPNTLGMVMHADGGLLGSKPYAASGKYIDRMGNYCKNCRYRVKDTLGEDACPFNALYWDFLMRHRERFESNHRMKMMFRNVDRMDDERQKAIQDRAKWIKEHIEEL